MKYGFGRNSYRVCNIRNIHKGFITSRANVYVFRLPPLSKPFSPWQYIASPSFSLIPQLIPVAGDDNEGGGSGSESKKEITRMDQYQHTLLHDFMIK